VSRAVGLAVLKQLYVKSNDERSQDLSSILYSRGLGLRADDLWKYLRRMIWQYSWPASC